MNNLIEGLSISIVGVLTTFAALVLILCVIKGLSLLCGTQSAPPTTTSTSAPVYKMVATDPAEIPAEDVAAIMAVISSMGTSVETRITIKPL